jgi:hypothetical protein
VQKSKIRIEHECDKISLKGTDILMVSTKRGT